MAFFYDKDRAEADPATRDLWSLPGYYLRKGVGGMAVNTTPLSSNLLILVENDTATGNLTRKYAELKTDAADQDVYDVGTALAALQTRTLSAINRNQVYEIEAV